MRLGGPVLEEFSDPESWVSALRRAGFRAAFCPVGNDAGQDVIAAYADAAEAADILIAEVGAWSNPLSDDESERRQAVTHCQKQLALADQIGARCCVNVTGSRGTRWAGPHPQNLTDETFRMIVESVQSILDEVKPTRTFYTLETMPWMYPDSADSYLRLIKAIDRRQFAVHLDPVNLINCPQRYFENAALLRDCFRKLGPLIKSCHAKDIVLADELTVHLDEVAPGQGTLDYTVYLRELNKLDADTPLMLEHLKAGVEYARAAAHIRSVAAEAGVTIH